MKKIYLTALSAIIGVSLMAQVSVTFQVDMSDEAGVSANGVHVAGSWQSEANGADDWQPGANAMMDMGDGIWALTVDLPAGDYQYKFINGNNWDPDGTNLGNEGVPSIVQNGGNRFFTITDWHGGVDGEGNPNLPNGFVLPAVKYAQSAPEGKVALRVEVDMTNETVDATGVHVAGTIVEPNWTPQYGSCSSLGNNQYVYVAHVDPNSTYEYKFLTGDFWGFDENAVGPCANAGNRVIDVAEEDVETPAYCFGACETCSDPNVTLTVDLSNADGDEIGHVAGDFNGWGGEPMNDNGDGTFSISLFLAEGTYQFKFQNGLGGWESVPGDCATDGNRVLEVGPDPVEFSACLNQCTAECIPDPDPADITFQVDMNNETVSPDGVWLIASFTGFQANAIQLMDDDADGIYTTTTEVSGPADIQYKYVNGDVNDPANEESADFAAGGCGVSNGIGGWNRTHTRTGEPEVRPVVAFNSCQPLSTNELELGEVAIFPNPANGIAFIDVPNPNGYTLRMNIVDITGKAVRENVVLNTSRYEINTNDLNAGLYFLNIINERSERAVFKLMVK
jgi:hypothetical protein